MHLRTCTCARSFISSALHALMKFVGMIVVIVVIGGCGGSGNVAVVSVGGVITAYLQLSFDYSQILFFAMTAHQNCATLVNKYFKLCSNVIGNAGNFTMSVSSSWPWGGCQPSSSLCAWSLQVTTAHGTLT